MENSLSPAFVRIDYRSTWATHIALLGTSAWFPTSITGTLGSYLSHDGDPLDAEVMINAFVDKLAAQHKATTNFDLATVYTQAAPVGQAIPRASASLTQVGSNAAGGPDKATQLTLNGRTTLFGHFKLVLLDVPVGTSNFDKQFPSTFPSTISDIFTEYALTDNAWLARDGGQPSFPISATITLNERLRKEYRQA